MLRILTVVAALSLAIVSGQASAKRNYGVAGCGLGSLIIDPGGSQTSAATTNGTAYNQYFGITSGTSNCTPTSDMAVIVEQEKFVVANLGTLSKDMARGQGESLSALSETLGCSSSVLPQFSSHLQNGYGEIFTAPGAIAVLDATKAQLMKDELFRTNCKHINI